MGSHWHGFSHEVLKEYSPLLNAKVHRVDHALGQAFQKTSSVAPLRLSSIENVRSGMLFSIRGTTPPPHIDNVEILYVLSHFVPMLGRSVRSALPWVPHVLALVLRR